MKRCLMGYAWHSSQLTKPPLLAFRVDSDHTIRLDLRHSTWRGLSLDAANELVEIHVVPDAETNVHRARIRRAHVIARFSKVVAAADGLSGITVLPKSSMTTVELNEAHVEARSIVLHVADADGARFDLLSRASRSAACCEYVRREVAIAHHFGAAAEHFGIELSVRSMSWAVTPK